MGHRPVETSDGNGDPWDPKTSIGSGGETSVTAVGAGAERKRMNWDDPYGGGGLKAFDLNLDLSG